MHRHALLVSSLVVACSGTGDDDTTEPPLPCLFTDTPSAVSFRVETGGPGRATCTLDRIDQNDSETVLAFGDCDGVTETATITLGAVPALPLDLDLGERLEISSDTRSTSGDQRHRLAIHRGTELVVAAMTASRLSYADGYFLPLTFSLVPGECEPAPQICAGGTFAADRQIIGIEGAKEKMSVATRHAFDLDGRHVRVEQADEFIDSSGCDEVGPGWYDFVVALDRG